MNLDWAHAERPAPGEKVSGDRALVVRAGDVVVLAVIDALGHGPRADDAARLAQTALEATGARGASLLTIFDEVHRALRGSRGAAMSLVRIDGLALETAGVGNVGLRVVGTSLGLVTTPGVLGAQHRPIRITRGTLAATARLVLHSDGISSRLDVEAVASMSPADASKRILAAHHVPHDDATVLVVDVRAT